MKLMEVCIGELREIEWQGKTLVTGIFKTPVQERVYVERNGLRGDHIGNLKVHGGEEKAVYGYGYQAYSTWKQKISEELPHLKPTWTPGIFGENLLFDYLDEKELFLGDVFKIGETCCLQVSEPRFPCSKLGMRFQEPKIIPLFLESRLSGSYFRVLKEGWIQRGDAIALISQEKIKVSIKEIVDFYVTKKMEPERAEEILSIKSLGPSWREMVLKQQY